MASGHEYRANRPNTWLLRPLLQSEDSSCPDGRWAKHVRSALVIQTSTCSAIASASSTSMPRYRTVLSILVWPSQIPCAAVDQRCLGPPQRVGAKHPRVKPDACHPVGKKASILAGCHRPIAYTAPS